ncbi:hypothetical protein C7I85_24715 [Mesorhizobium soli]|uniref:Uncharacterized protein n=1 Tax=Pseudaminobacter soli (ex Li et al. 2025) TaxID=1295366 RepID=A0A2P7S201_9HYPH|nr:hypothetical protein C7I85_24715 [Mesorhizobium soli]
MKGLEWIDHKKFVERLAVWAAIIDEVQGLREKFSEQVDNDPALYCERKLIIVVDLADSSQHRHFAKVNSGHWPIKTNRVDDVIHPHGDSG